MGIRYIDEEFSGWDAARSGFSWAQHWWLDIFGNSTFDNPRINVPLRLRFETGVPLDAVRHAVRFSLRRHGGLRTVYPSAADGEREQIMLGSGAYRIGVVETGSASAEDVEAAMDDVLESLCHTLPPQELPFTLTALVRDGLTVALVGWIQHLSADGLAALILREEIRLLVSEPDAPLPRTWTIADLVAFEQSEKGKRQAELAALYQHRQVAEAAGRQAPTERAPGSTPRYFELAFNSEAVSTGARILAARHGMTEENVLLTALNVVRARADGHAVSTLSIASSNRFRSPMRAMVANLFQDSLLSVDVSGVRTFADLAHATTKASLLAYKFGHFDPRTGSGQWAPDPAKTAQEPDFSWSVSLRIGDVEGIVKAGPAGRQELRDQAAARPEAVRELTGQTRVWPLAGHDQRPVEAMFAVWGMETFASISFTADSQRYSVDEVTGFLGDFEELIVRAVENDSGKIDY